MAVMLHTSMDTAHIVPPISSRHLKQNLASYPQSRTAKHTTLLGLYRYFAPVSYACDPYHPSFSNIQQNGTLLCSLSRIHPGCRRRQLVHMGDYLSSVGQGRRDGRDGKSRSSTNTISLSIRVCVVSRLCLCSRNVGFVCGVIVLLLYCSVGAEIQFSKTTGT